MGYFVVKQVPTGIKFDLKAGNHETIATSEVYSSSAACMNGIKSVQTNAEIAKVEDQTKENFDKEKNPKYEVYVDKKGEYRFRLTARNGEVIAASEGYTSLAGCMNGVESVRKNAPNAEVKTAE